MKELIQNEKLKKLTILFAICSCAIIIPVAVISGIVKAASASSEDKGDTVAESRKPEPEDDSVADGEVTSKGYKIENINGVTFVDGILIVNKTYSLPKDYAPKDLTEDTQKAFDEMQKDAAEEGVKLWVQSGYRSYERQEELYNGYKDENGLEYAEEFSARPGYSEHQSGLSFDVNEAGTNFEETKEGVWIEAHAHEYGFIIRFPEGKKDFTGYEFEPWHLRFVGKELAGHLKDSGECLEEYLGITSEYK